MFRGNFDLTAFLHVGGTSNKDRSRSIERVKRPGVHKERGPVAAHVHNQKVEEAWHRGVKSNNMDSSKRSKHVSKCQGQGKTHSSSLIGLKIHETAFH